MFTCYKIRIYRVEKYESKRISLFITGKAREQIANVTENSYKSIYYQPIQSRKLSNLPNKLSLHIILIHVPYLNIFMQIICLKVIFCFMSILNKMKKKTQSKKLAFRGNFHEKIAKCVKVRICPEMRGPGTQSYEMGRNPSPEHTELSQCDWCPERKRR